MVKSPPELWAECSEAASLARHLGQFGEIRITRLEPETAVAWEGEEVSGTVRLEPSGWGTRVILTARAAGAQKAPAPQAPAAEEPPPQAPAADAPPPPPDPEPEPEPLPPAATGSPVAPESAPVASEPESPTSARPARRAGLIARLMALFQPPEPAPPPAPDPPAPQPAPDPPAPTIGTAPEPAPSTSAPPPTPRPAAVPRPAAHSPESVIPTAERESPEPPDLEVGDEPDHAAVLSAALDSLGQAHHRPYSRA